MRLLRLASGTAVALVALALSTTASPLGSIDRLGSKHRAPQTAVHEQRAYRQSLPVVESGTAKTRSTSTAAALNGTHGPVTIATITTITTVATTATTTVTTTLSTSATPVPGPYRPTPRHNTTVTVVTTSSTTTFVEAARTETPTALRTATSGTASTAALPDTCYASTAAPLPPSSPPSSPPWLLTSLPPHTSLRRSNQTATAGTPSSARVSLPRQVPSDRPAA